MAKVVADDVPEAQLVRLLSDLVAIESVNPAYPSGERGEGAMAAFVEDYCRRLGLDVSRQPVLPGRDNVLAALRVPGARRTLLFEVHMDTVGLDGLGGEGLQAAVRDGRLYGRGACDAKGALASMLAARELLLARRNELGVNVLLLASVDEEYQYRGILRFIDSIPGDPSVDAAVVGEPTELRVVVAHKGCVRTRITTVGRAAHSSRPEEGINAIEHMAGVVAALREHRRTIAERRHPLVGNPTLSIGRIWGGTAVNIVPDRCTIEIDRRTIPGENAAGALAEIDAVLAGLRRKDGSIIVKREEPFVADWALDTPVDTAVVRAAATACRDTGVPGGPVGVAYGSDASKLWALRGIPSIVLGPGSIAQAHTDDEYVPVAHLSLAVQVYARTAMHLAAAISE
ncbi:MAG: M20 family metallopeptidase [Chloroflexi bacterium]|nr:M20 family metallopeptidase [Chloroflexota bacterium]